MKGLPPRRLRDSLNWNRLLLLLYHIRDLFWKLRTVFDFAIFRRREREHLPQTGTTRHQLSGRRIQPKFRRESRLQTRFSKWQASKFYLKRIESYYLELDDWRLFRQYHYP